MACEINLTAAAQNTHFLDINNVRCSMRRIRFTKKELDLIIEMTCIAEAGSPDGDYQGWDTEGKYETMDSLTTKAAELLRRFGGGIQKKCPTL